MFVLCDRLKKLPEEIRRQPYRDIEDLITCINVEATVQQAYREARGGA